MDKYRFCSPKGSSKPKEVNCSLEMKPLHVFQRMNKENQQNLSEIKQLHDFGEEELEIEEQIGAGTFGKVYRARLRSSGQLVALKRVQQDKKYKTR